jgi:hypothetical protein
LSGEIPAGGNKWKVAGILLLILGLLVLIGFSAGARLRLGYFKDRVYSQRDSIPYYPWVIQVTRVAWHEAGVEGDGRSARRLEVSLYLRNKSLQEQAFDYEKCAIQLPSHAAMNLPARSAEDDPKIFQFRSGEDGVVTLFFEETRSGEKVLGQVPAFLSLGFEKDRKGRVSKKETLIRLDVP